MSQHPPFFHWCEPALFDEWLRIGLRRPSGHLKAVYPAEQEVFLAWRHLCEKADDPGAVFDLGDLHEVMDQLQEKERNFAAIRRVVLPRLNILSHAGVLWRERATPMGMKRAYRFALRSPLEVARGWIGGPSDSQENKATAKLDKRRQNANDKLVEATYRHLMRLGYVAQPVECEEPRDSEPWTLHLISQLIERCSRANSRSEEEYLEAVIRLNGEPVQIEAGRVYRKWENSLEYGLVTADDAQLILAILTLAMQNITKDLEAGVSPPRNRITFDLYELSKMLSPSGDRYAYQLYQQSMARIINTEYRLTPLSNDGAPRSRVSLRLVEDVVEGEDTEGFIDGDTWNPSSNMRYFSFSLNSHIWRGLLNGHDWLVHPKLLYERNGLVHKVYHHLRTNAGQEEPYVVTGEALMYLLNISPGKNASRGRTKFCRDLEQLLKARGESEPLLFTRQDEAMTLRLYDLDLVIHRDESAHKGGLRIEALQSPETQLLLQRQEARLRELRAMSSRGDIPRLGGDGNSPPALQK